MYKVRIVELSKPKHLYAVSVRNQYLYAACSGNYDFKVWGLVKMLLFR